MAKEDQEVVNSIAQGDRILSITIEGDDSSLMEKIQARVRKWNEKLNRHFPNLEG
jgi:hypothetical protein